MRKLLLLTANVMLVTSTPTQPSETKEKYTWALLVLGVIYFIIGFVTCLNDTLVPYFKKGFSLTYFESSLVQFYFFLTYGIMSIPAGKIVAFIGYKKGIQVGLSIAALGAFMFFPAALFGQYSMFLAALFILAIGVVLLQVAANPYITVLGPSETASARLTLIQGLGSVGTTVAPLFGAHFILAELHNTAEEGVHYPYIGIALFLAIVAFLLIFIRMPSISDFRTTASVKQQVRQKNLFSFKHLNLGALAIFLYVGAEVSIGTFLTNYIMDEVAIGEAHANHLVTYYWGGMMIGRFVGSFLLKGYRPNRVLFVCAAIAVLLVATSLMASGWLAVGAMIAVGFANSVMFAIIFSLSVKGLGELVPRASGLLSSTIVGGALMAVSVGMIKDYYDWNYAFLLPVLSYLYIIFYAWSGYKTNRHIQPESYK